MNNGSPKPPRNRKGKQVYVGIGALTAGFAFIVYVGGENATYVTFATAVCSLCGVGIWGNVKEHQAQQQEPPATNGSGDTGPTSTPPQPRGL